MCTCTHTHMHAWVRCLKPEEGWNTGVAGSCEPLSLHAGNEIWVLEKINHWAIIPPASVVWVKHCHRGTHSTLHGKQSRLLLSTICGLCTPLTVHQGVLVMRMAHTCHLTAEKTERQGGLLTWGSLNFGRVESGSSPDNLFFLLYQG